MASRLDIMVADAKAQIMAEVKAEMDALRSQRDETQKALAEAKAMLVANAAAHAAESDHMRQRITALEAPIRKRAAEEAAIAEAAARLREVEAADAEKRRVTELVRAGKVKAPARP